MRDGIECPNCGKRVQLRNNGYLRKHTSTTPAFPGAPFNAACPGGGPEQDFGPAAKNPAPEREPGGLSTQPTSTEGTA